MPPAAMGEDIGEQSEPSRDELFATVRRWMDEAEKVCRMEPESSDNLLPVPDALDYGGQKSQKAKSERSRWWQ